MKLSTGPKFHKIIFISFLLFTSSFSALIAKDGIPCSKDEAKKCADTLSNYPLFDTEYKVAANYVPVLPLRALAHADIYKEKKSARLERYFYIKDLAGNFSKPYQNMIVNIKVGGNGLIGRKITAEGNLNEFKIFYENKAGFSLPKKASMRVKALLEGFPFLDLKILSDGDEMTNDVEGKFLGREVDYHTNWRTTNGTLAAINYDMFVKGLVKDKKDFKVVSKGKIGSTEISGEGWMTKPGHYEFKEQYGPILIKSYLQIIDPASN